MDSSRDHWKLILGEGILFVILGILAIALPIASTLSIEILIGSLLVIGGVIQAIRALQSMNANGSYISLLNATIAIILGILMLVYPLTGVLTLTLLLTIFFFLEGIVKIGLALQWRPMMKQWGWMLFSGILAILLGFLILSGWPGTAVWVLGLLFGINLLFAGWSLIALALAFKNNHSSTL